MRRQCFYSAVMANSNLDYKQVLHFRVMRKFLRNNQFEIVSNNLSPKKPKKKGI